MNQTATLTVPAPGVLSNDSDIESPLTASLVTPPAVGTLSFNSNGSFRYTPPLLFSGTVSFVYSVSDGNGGTDTATVVITVNPNVVGVGRMTGGGSVFTSSNERVTYGMVLLCNAAASFPLPEAEGMSPSEFTLRTPPVFYTHSMV